MLSRSRSYRRRLLSFHVSRGGADPFLGLTTYLYQVRRRSRPGPLARFAETEPNDSFNTLDGAPAITSHLDDGVELCSAAIIAALSEASSEEAQLGGAGR